MTRFGHLTTTIVIACWFMALLLSALNYAIPVQAQTSAATTTPVSESISTTVSETRTNTVSSTGTVTVADTGETITQEGSPIGYLTFAHSDASIGSLFHLRLDDLPPAPTEGQYVLWLLSALTDTYKLHTFTGVDGQVDISGTTDIDLPLFFNEARITLEALDNQTGAGESITTTATFTMSERVVLRAMFSPTVVERLRPLLNLYMEEAVTTPTTDADPDPALDGALTATQSQVNTAVQHTGFLRNALTQEDIPQARRHAEHIINILDGKNGFIYGDLDRSGLAENPGDGVGVRTYLAAVKAALPTVEDLFSTMGNGDESAADLSDAVDVGLAHITDMFDKALQIFAADTVTEANRFAGELTTLVDDLNAAVDKAHNLTLQLVTYRFYGPAQPVVLPVSTTILISTTASNTVTATLTDPVTSTATDPVKPTLTPTAALRLRPTNTATAVKPTLNRLTRSSTATPGPTANTTLSPTAQPTATATPPLAPTAVPPLPIIESSALTNPRAGARWQSPLDDIVYIYVPGGAFEMGADGANAASPKEEPRHEVSVDGFWLQQTETTNAQYARCIEAGACTPPSNTRWDDAAFAEHPVSNVTWQQANAYAGWVGGRLPTEAEWEHTCRGGDDRTYPWGNSAPTDADANYNNTIGDTAPVGSYPAGQSAFGLLDLSGNLWEWTSSLETSYPYDATDGREAADLDAGNRTVRGGSFYYTNYQIRCAARTGFVPDTANEHIGFRLVLDAPSAVMRNPADGSLYLYVPGGTFEMGADAANAASPKEEPRHEVSVDGFWLQQTETTNAQYARCVEAGACAPPSNTRWDDAAFAEHPVSNVTWQQANAYAGWVGGRLPTEAEWEHTCRAGDDRTYPWGNSAPTDADANYNNTIGDTAPVGSYPAGQSAFGLLDLSGNLWEWTSSLETSYPYDATDGREAADLDAGNRTVRGGSFYYTNYQIRCAARTGFVPDTANEHIGLRVVLAIGDE